MVSLYLMTQIHLQVLALIQAEIQTLVLKDLEMDSKALELKEASTESLLVKVLLLLPLDYPVKTLSVHRTLSMVFQTAL